MLSTSACVPGIGWVGGWYQMIIGRVGVRVGCGSPPDTDDATMVVSCRASLRVYKCFKEVTDKGYNVPTLPPVPPIQKEVRVTVPGRSHRALSTLIPAQTCAFRDANALKRFAGPDSASVPVASGPGTDLRD
eukprot:767960-Hanusia_phi.AAC.1